MHAFHSIAIALLDVQTARYRNVGQCVFVLQAKTQELLRLQSLADKSEQQV